MSNFEERRAEHGSDRRRCPRGGRRPGDKDGRSPTVAIVDQYEGARLPCARYLSFLHFDVAEVSEPAEGLALLERRRPAVILMADDQAGRFERLQDRARAQAIPIVSMATAFGDAAQQHADDLGAAGVLLKPFSLGAMLEEIRRVLRAQVATG